MKMIRSCLGAVMVASMLAIGVTSAALAEIKIGAIQPLTGAFAAAGNDVSEGAKIAVEEINAEGGVLGEQLVLIVEDSKSNPTEAAAAAEKLIVRDEVPVLMGASGSPATLAVMPKLMEYKVPMLVETSTAGSVTTSGNPYVFRIAPPASLEAAAFAEMVDQLEIGKADLLVVNNDWGVGTAEEFRKMFEEKGIEVGLVETMDAATQDIGAQLSKIRASDADALVVTTAVEQLTLVLRQAASLGLDRKIISTGGSQNPDQLIQQAGEAANGSFHLVFFAPWVPEASPSPEIAKAFVKAWEERGHPFAGLTSSFRGYDGIRAIAAAIEKAGSAEPEAIRQAFWEVEVEGLNGTISFQKVGPEGSESGQSEPQVYLVQIKEGQVVVPEF